MVKSVKDVMLPLSEYAVVDDDATILDALKVLKASQQKLPPDRQPHRAVLVRNRTGAIIGKLHHFAFLRALVAEREPMIERNVFDRAGVDDSLLASSMRTLDLLTGDFVDVCERAKSVVVGDVCTPAEQGISEDASLADATAAFLESHTLSLLVRRAGVVVGILRLSDLFDEFARQIMQDKCD
jgi:hypothetical protein